MKKQISPMILLLLCIGLVLPPTGISQSQQVITATTTDTLRKAVSQLEAIKAEASTDSVRLLHKRTLMSAYQKFQAHLSRDLEILEQMKFATDGAEVETQKEIARQVEKLSNERKDVIEKIKKLNDDPQAAESVVVPMSVEMPASVEMLASAAPTSSAPLMPVKMATTTRPRTTTTRPLSTPPIFIARNDISAAVNSLVAPRSTAVGVVNETVAASINNDTATVAATLSATVCGQITPASLNQTIALIKITPELSNLANRFRMPDDPLVNSTIGDDCQPRGEMMLMNGKTSTVLRDGSQKTAVVDLLKQLLYRVNPDLTPRDLEINKDSREKQRQQVTEQFKINESEISEAGRKRARSSRLSTDTIRKQILLLEQYTGNVAVHLTKKDGTLVKIDYTDRDGNFIISFNPKPEDKFYVSTEADNHKTKREVLLEADKAERVNIEIDDRPVSLLTRAVVGYEQAGASAAKRDQSYFFNLFISSSVPFPQKINPDFGERFRAWADIRLASVPQPGDATLGAFTANFAQQVGGVPVKDTARVIEFLGGLEFRVAGNNSLLPSFDRDTKQKFSLSLIAGFGTTTPTDPLETLATFKVFKDAPGLPVEARDKEFVTFVSTDRDRFFRQYYGGFRVQTLFFTRHNIPMQRFPAQLDITYGQNEFVTGGKFRGGAFRLDGYFPLPYADLKFLNLFGTAMLRPGRVKLGTPLVLEAAPAGTVVPGSNVALVLSPQINRDYYRVGVGIDFIPFIDAFRNAFKK
ncbi:MAG: hypothetical protein M3R15_27750 [Acidobacteriota bacterium]|nr:hypothetical protein [Acidobacteriota bacterium]